MISILVWYLIIGFGFGVFNYTSKRTPNSSPSKDEKIQFLSDVVLWLPTIIQKLYKSR